MANSIPLASTPTGQVRRGHAAAMQANMLGYLEHVAAQGDILKISLPLTSGYLINHPDLINAVMLKQAHNFHKSWLLKYVANQLFGDNLFTSDGDLWRLLRTTLQPAFRGARLQGYVQTMVDATAQMLQGWRAGDTLEMTERLMGLTLRTTTQCFFGLDLSRYSAGQATDFSGQDLIRFIELFFQRITSLPVPLWIPSQSNRELKRLIRSRNDFFLPMIAQRRRDQEDRGDVLSLLIEAQRSDATGQLTDLQVCNEVSNLFAAGYEVTAYSLAFTLYLIARHPEVEAELVAELDRVVGQRRIVAEDLADLVYLEQVLKEGMRLFPVTAVVSRQAIAPVHLQDYRLPKNSLVLIAPWVLHRRADLYANPLVFQPERFAPGQQSQRPKMAYLPFSGGPRGCIGQGFALMQMKINLAMLYQRFHVSLVPDYQFQPVFQFNTRLHGGLPMVVSDRL